MKNVLKNKDSVATPQPHYGTLDGLRTIAVVGIVMMHVLTNMPLNFGNYLAQTHHSRLHKFHLPVYDSQRILHVLWLLHQGERGTDQP